MNKTSPFKSALQDGVCERVRAYAVEIKPGTLRVSLMYAFGRAYGLPYKMATFIAAKGLFNTVFTGYKPPLPLCINI